MWHITLLNWPTIQIPFNHFRCGLWKWWEWWYSWIPSYSLFSFLSVKKKKRMNVQIIQIWKMLFVFASKACKGLRCNPWKNTRYFFKVQRCSKWVTSWRFFSLWLEEALLKSSSYLWYRYNTLLRSFSYAFIVSLVTLEIRYPQQQE